jgi:hypothetical protein
MRKLHLRNAYNRNTTVVETESQQLDLMVTQAVTLGLVLDYLQAVYGVGHKNFNARQNHKSLSSRVA